MLIGNMYNHTKKNYDNHHSTVSSTTMIHQLVHRFQHKKLTIKDDSRKLHPLLSVFIKLFPHNLLATTYNIPFQDLIACSTQSTDVTPRKPNTEMRQNLKGLYQSPLKYTLFYKLKQKLSESNLYSLPAFRNKQRISSIENNFLREIHQVL